MAIKTKDEILAQMNSILGDNTDDNVLALIEDVSDTYSDLSERASDQTDWKQKYDDLDKSWRDKYRARFFGAKPDDEDEIKPKSQEEDKPAPKTYMDLFKVEKG